MDALETALARMNSTGNSCGRLRVRNIVAMIFFNAWAKSKTLPCKSSIPNRSEMKRALEAPSFHR